MRYKPPRPSSTLLETWGRHYDTIRPHGSLGYRPSAPEPIVAPGWPPGSATLRQPTSLADKSSMH